MSIPPKIKRHFVGILVLVLIVSVGLNLHDHFITFPHTLHKVQATSNNMRIEALQALLSKMELVKNLLKKAKTKVDVLEASGHTSWAKRFANIFASGIDIYKHQEKLYYWVHHATLHLYEALDRVYLRTVADIDQNILAMIGNVTTNVENLESKAGILSPNGVDPAQQLREAGVLTDVLNYLEQMYQVSVDIHNYYR